MKKDPVTGDGKDLGLRDPARQSRPGFPYLVLARCCNMAEGDGSGAQQHLESTRLGKAGVKLDGWMI